MKKLLFFCFLVAPIKHAFLIEHTVTCYIRKNADVTNTMAYGTLKGLVHHFSILSENNC